MGVDPGFRLSKTIRNSLTGLVFTGRSVEAQRHRQLVPEIGMVNMRQTAFRSGVYHVRCCVYRKGTFVLILIVILVLVLGGGGGFYGHSRWGYGGGAGIGLGTILLILLVAYMLGAFH